ncbi:MAG: hypothetical protein LBU42_04265 [Prevotellaceae bacterium]|jgi:hypothetical protein|nr:hypothetical protein [Prevotellaceae bacterium]
MEVRVLNGQSLFDIAIQAAGSVEAVFDIALASGLSITDELISGAALAVPAVAGRKVADYYAANGIRPATAIGAQDIDFILEGIGFWRLEYDFMIS